MAGVETQLVTLKEVLSQAHIVGLYRTPLKGGRMESIQEANLTTRGIEGDRELMLIADGKWRNKEDMEFMNGKVIPQLGLVDTSITDGVFSANAPGLEISLHVRKEGEVLVASMYGEEVETIDQGDDAARAFSEYSGVPVRLVRIREGFHRLAKPNYDAGHSFDELGLQDGGRLTVGSIESRDDLNQRIMDRGNLPVDRGVFRNNIMIAGSGIPYGEDSIRRMRVGDVEILLTRESVRCVVTTRNPHTIERHPQGEPLNTMNKYRNLEGRGVIFDQNAIQDYPLNVPPDTVIGKIAVGQRVQVLETKTPPLLYTGPLSQPIPTAGR